ncbi:hypothetical protein D9M68_444980 [compost metagenome]
MNGCHGLGQGGRPLRQAVAGELAQGTGGLLQQRCAQYAAGAVGHPQGQARALEGGGEVAGQPVGAAAVVGLLRTQLAYQVAGVDAHRATLGAETGGGAGVDALVLVGPLQFRGVDAGALLGLDIAPYDDALARAQGQSFRWADRLAEAALDALVDDLVGGGQGLEVLQVDVAVLAEDHVGVEDAARVQQALDLPHQLIGIAAPFQLDEGRHVAPRAVLGLERAAEFHRHQLRHVLHEGVVAGHLFRAVEALGEDEVQVALQGMAENDRLVVAVFVEEGQ